jgi:tRNA threonylcarbamoyladenosine biosynthesis protein TsaE
MKIVIKNKEGIPAAVHKLLKLTGNNRILAFYGAMGSGKTTIIKILCKTLGAIDIATSPTFTLVNEYKTVRGEFIYHIDFYRIKKREEVFDFGIEEYFSSGTWCLMEWPELIEGILPEATVRISIMVGENQERILEIL